MQRILSSQPRHSQPPDPILPLLDLLEALWSKVNLICCKFWHTGFIKMCNSSESTIYIFLCLHLSHTWFCLINCCLCISSFWIQRVSGRREIEVNWDHGHSEATKDKFQWTFSFFKAGLLYSKGQARRGVPHTAKNRQLATRLLTSCNRFEQQADIKVCSQGLWPLICIILDHALKIKFWSHRRHIGTPGPAFFAGVRESF